MSIQVIVERRDGQPIALPDWLQAVALDSDLRLRTAPYEATNPRTGAVIRMPSGEADAELRAEGEWVPFLSFGRGRLTIRYIDAFEDPRNPVRAKIVAVARRFDAVIGSDAGDDPLGW